MKVPVIKRTRRHRHAVKYDIMAHENVNQAITYSNNQTPLY